VSVKKAASVLHGAPEGKTRFPWTLGPGIIRLTGKKNGTKHSVGLRSGCRGWFELEPAGCLLAPFVEPAAGRFPAQTPGYEAPTYWVAGVTTAIIFFACLFAHAGMSSILRSRAHGRGPPGNRTLNLRIKRPTGLDPLTSDFVCYPRSEAELSCQLLTSNHAYSHPSTW
jgi:hypothetical protein